MEKLSIADSYNSVNAVPFVSTNYTDITNDLIHSNLSNDLNNRQEIKYKTKLYSFNTVDKGTSTRSTKQQKDNEDKEVKSQYVEDTDIIATEINTYDETNPKGETIFIELPQVQFKEDEPKQEQFDTILEFLYKYSNNPLIITFKNRADGRFNQMNY
ncbi:hypothetical protein CEXT_442511 [Caerostris extrusa]|uniref:Uncharacterized protein n=1 Tax=Caerostris extrusa TaxID=172846 RepID=A0AAV4Y8U5_CAEEX|nr:hypothetical protein CEXT_442511 [Caerostris extrusa]